MGYIREPEGVDFVVNSEPISPLEISQISDVISHYKKTGEVKKILPSKRDQSESKNG